MTIKQDQRDVQARFQKLEGLLRAVERIASPDTQATVHELLQTLLEVEGVVGQDTAATAAAAPAAGFIPLSALLSEPDPGAASEAWVEVAGLGSLAAGGLRTMNVNGQTVLFSRVGQELYAYQHKCP